MGRGVRTVKGALLAVLGVFLAISCLASWAFSMVIMPAAENAGERLEEFRRYGPYALLGMCLLTLLNSSGERSPVRFSPPEVDFLFPGPFSRRQLLAYKLIVGFLSIALGAVFLLMWSSSLRFGHIPLAARYAGLLLALIFIHLFSVVIGFTASAIGARAYNRVRKVILAAVVGLLVFVALGAGGGFLRQAPQEMFRHVEQSPIAQTLLAPFRWFVLALTAPRLWPDFAQWAGSCLLVDAVLLVLAFVMDVHYLESAAAASERLYAQLQRVRTGGAAAATLRVSGPVRFSLPSLPWWGGIGPIAWRQMLAVPRSRATIVFLCFLVPLFAMAFIPNLRAAGGEHFNISVFLGGQIIAMTIIMSGLFAFDFRADIGRMDVLKALPIAPVPLVIGELVTPVLFVSLIQAVALGVIVTTAVKPDAAVHFALALPFAIPFNFLLFAVDNLLFLHFPTKVLNVSPADFQAMGRYALTNLARFLVLGLATGVAAVAGLVVHLIANSALAALVTAWVLLAVFGATLVPFIALAFRQFDVARDTPPE
jgi:hypothetical protein